MLDLQLEARASHPRKWSRSHAVHQVHEQTLKALTVGLKRSPNGQSSISSRTCAHEDHCAKPTARTFWIFLPMVRSVVQWSLANAISHSSPQPRANHCAHPWCCHLTHFRERLVHSHVNNVYLWRVCLRSRVAQSSHESKPWVEYQIGACSPILSAAALMVPDPAQVKHLTQINRQPPCTSTHRLWAVR
jgi:hypothetical protein